MANETIEVLRIPGTLFPRGPFDENAAYKFLNFVESGGNGYVCLQPCTGIPVTNTAYWFKFVFKGDKGDAFTYADLTAEQKAELVRDATAAAQAAASSAQSAADDAAAALQKFNTIKAAIDAIDPQSTEGSIQTLAAKQGLLEADLNALGPKIGQITGETIEYNVNSDLPSIYQGKQLKALSSDIGNTIAQITKNDNANYHNKKVPLNGVSKIEFFLYPSTSSYGCLFVNANDKIVAVKSRTSSGSGDISMSVPSGAVYFIWSYNATYTNYCRTTYEQTLTIKPESVIDENGKSVKETIGDLYGSVEEGTDSNEITLQSFIVGGVVAARSFERSNSAAWQSGGNSRSAYISHEVLENIRAEGYTKLKVVMPTAYQGRVTFVKKMPEETLGSQTYQQLIDGGYLCSVHESEDYNKVCLTATANATSELDIPEDAYAVFFQYRSNSDGASASATLRKPSSLVATAKFVNGDIQKLQAATEELKTRMDNGVKLTEVIGKNLLNKNADDYIEQAYIDANGNLVQNSSSTDVDMSGMIPLTQEIGYLTLSYNGGGFTKTWYCNVVYYDENKQFLSATQYGTGQTGTITAEWSTGVAYVRFALRHYTEDVTKYQVELGQSATAFEPYSVTSEFDVPNLKIKGSQIAKQAITSEHLSSDIVIPTTAPALSLCGEKGESITQATLSNGAISIQNWPQYIKASAIVSAVAQMTSFNEVRVGIGRDSIRGKYVKIDATNIYFFKGDSSVADKTTAHGLSIGTFIKVVFIVDGLDTTAIISTIDGYKRDVFTYTDSSGNREAYGHAYIYADSSTTLTDVKLNVNCPKLRCPIWIFGDSMASEFDERWPYYTRYKWGFDYYLDALAGGKSTDLYTDLVKALEHGTPKFLVWMLGANDLRASDVASYKAYVNAVETICSGKGIELILVKQPQFHTFDTSEANTWMLTKGHRYIDFYAATGSNSEGDWYNGYISSDDIHPSVLGAKAEASQMCVDFPEIMQ